MKHKTLNIKHSRRGSTLLLSLLVLATMLVITVSISQIVSIEMSLARSNNYTVIATYAAESALEQAAYRVRNSTDTLSQLSANQTLSNQATWSRTAAPNEAALILRSLPKNLTKGFDLWNPDPPGSGAANKESVKITIDSCDGTEWIELGYVAFDPNDFSFGNFQKFRYHCTAGAGSVIYSNAIQAPKAYRLYVRYVQGTPAAIGRMTVTSCTGDNGLLPCDLPGRVNLSAQGAYRTATRTMGLTMPRISPMTGVFDYAIFSECQIIKDPTNTNPSCTP